MLTLVGGQVESLWDEVLPIEVRELPDDLARLDRVLSDSLVVVPDRAGVGGGRAGAGAAVDPDGDVRAVDGGQAAHGLGVRDAGAGGVGLAASAAVLSDRDRSAGPGRVDGPKARPPARCRGGGGDHQDGDREGAARDADSPLARRGSTRRWWRPTFAIRPTRCWRCRARGRSRARAASCRSWSASKVRVRDRSRSIGKAVRAISKTLAGAPARPRRR